MAYRTALTTLLLAASLPACELLACIGSMPAFSCDAVGRPTVIDCDDRFAAFYDCMGV